MRCEISVWIYMYVCMHICTNVCMYAYMRVCMYVCMRAASSSSSFHFFLRVLNLLFLFLYFFLLPTLLLKLNVNKSRELIIHGRARFVFPPPIPGVSRVEVLPVLGFVLSGDLSVGHHLTETLGSCSRSLYAVRILKAHGLPTSSL